MRIRTIKPEFWQHEGLAKLPDFTRLLAIALLNWADDEGYFLASPALIRGNLFPFQEDSRNIPGALQELSNARFIQVGCDDQERQIGFIVNFKRHQQINKPRPSKLKGLMQFPDNSGMIPGLLPEGSREEWNGKGMEEEGKPPVSPEGGATVISQEIPSPSLPETPTNPPSPAMDEAALAQKKEGGRGARRGKRETAPFSCPSEWPAEKRAALADWWEYKRQRGEPYTAMGWSKLVQMLARFSPGQLVTVVNDAIGNSWMGLPASIERLETGKISVAAAAAKNEGGAPGALAPAAPMGWEEAMAALWGATWRTVYAAWELMPHSDQRQVRAWLQKNKGGAV